MADSSRSPGSTEDGERKPDAPSILEQWSSSTVANALLVGGLLVVPLAFVNADYLSNQLLWRIIGIGLLSVAIGFLAVPHARITTLKPLQQGIIFKRSEGELAVRAIMAYLVLGAILLGIAGWVLFISTKV